MKPRGRSTGSDGRPLPTLSLEIDELAESWAAWYSERLWPRRWVAIWVEDSFAYSLHYYALSRMGIAVLIDHWAPTATADGLCERTSPVGIYSDDTHLERLRGLEDRGAERRAWPWCGPTSSAGKRFATTTRTPCRSCTRRARPASRRP